MNKDERMREEYSVKSRDDSQQSTTLPSKHHRHRVSSLTRKQASKRASEQAKPTTNIKQANKVTTSVRKWLRLSACCGIRCVTVATGRATRLAKVRTDTQTNTHTHIFIPDTCIPAVQRYGTMYTLCHDFQLPTENREVKRRQGREVLETCKQLPLTD